VAAGVSEVRRLLDRRDLDLKFVRRDDGRVHVIVPVDPYAEPGAFREWEELSDDEKVAVVSSLVRLEVRVLCGAVVVVPADGRGPGRWTDEFDDEDLCWSCWRALGPAHQHRAFEHRRPGDPETGS
jgi:hypothetical protein